jgi:DNA-binding MarR family transcriptional regulator
MNAPAGSDEGLVRDLGMLVRHLLGRSNQGVFKVFDDLELSFTQSKIVMSFTGREQQTRSVKSIADEHGLSLPAASRAVDGLLKRGLVTRTEDPDDRRIKQIAPTDEGRAITRRLYELRVGGIQEYVASLDPEDRGRLALALAAVTPRDALAEPFSPPADPGRTPANA